MTTALITGATSGIGKSFACQLAVLGFDLILVARDAIRLEKLCKEICNSNIVEFIAIDLTELGAGQKVFETIQERGLRVDWLVNNAGIGDYGLFETRNRDRQLAIIRLNILALVDLTYCFLPSMLEQQHGVIINVSSMAAFQPMPYWTVYGASKAFVLHFTEALRAEVYDRNIKVLCVCPGPVKTPFFDYANFPQDNQSVGLPLADVDQVVSQAIAASYANKQTIVVGFPLLHLLVNLHRFLPRGWLLQILKLWLRPRIR